MTQDSLKYPTLTQEAISVACAIAQYGFSRRDISGLRYHLTSLFNCDNKNIQLTKGFTANSVRFNNNTLSIPYACISTYFDKVGNPIPKIDPDDMPILINVWSKKNSRLEDLPSKDNIIDISDYYIRADYLNLSDQDFLNIICSALNGLVEFYDIRKGGTSEYKGCKIVDIRGLSKFTKTDIIIVADLHGNISNFEKILAHNGIEKRIEKGEAILVIAGDAVCPAEQAILGHDGLPYPITHAPLTMTEKCERLSDMDSSLRVIERILRLKAANPFHVHYLIGNHDNPYFFKTSKPISQNTYFQNNFLLRYGRDCRLKFVEYLNNSPLVFIAEGVVVTHGGPVKGKVFEELRWTRGDFVSILRKQNMDLKNMDYDIDQPYSNVVSQLVLGMHRLYNNRPWLTYSAADVRKFIDAIYPGNGAKYNFVVGHDHDFTRSEQDSSGTGEVSQSSKFWAWTYGPTFPNHYIVFSGGESATGYAVANGTGIEFIEVE